MIRSQLFRLLLLMPLVFSMSTLKAQVRNPVKWTHTVKAAGSGKYVVSMKAVLDKGWHIYSQRTPDGGPIPTSVLFIKNPLISMLGTVKEVGKLENHYEKLFGVDVKQFSNEVTFVQELTVKGKVKTNISGTIEYMVCNDTECLPPTTQRFTLALQ
jgi:DsbC/DsbD-like thiol-disulfide interchange protein